MNTINCPYCHADLPLSRYRNTALKKHLDRHTVTKEEIIKELNDHLSITKEKLEQIYSPLKFNYKVSEIKSRATTLNIQAALSSIVGQIDVSFNLGLLEYRSANRSIFDHVKYLEESIQKEVIKLGIRKLTQAI